READPLKALYIQAHEADIIRGPSAKAAAQSLEVVEYPASEGMQGAVVHVVSKIGSALIEWGDDSTSGYSPVGNDDDAMPPTKQNPHSSIWVDRYDARLLLDSLPTEKTLEATPASPSGWSDIPSDAEDTFFFTPDEMEDFHREKRRRLLEQTREERLKARQQEDGVEEETCEAEDVWGGSDEEPDDVQKDLMRRTATHLLSSPNAAQLELRILANHGSDRRFSFLRGRWKRAWNLAKAKARIEKEKEKEEKEAEKSAGLGVLAGYGSDDSESGGEDSGVGDVSVPTATEEPQAVEEPVKEARRKRLKEWAERRRATK
ncbi:hypothetical protein BDZ97DRAFT_1641017, partial [Flammula alnicola]